MKPLRQYCLLILFFFSFLSLSCKDSSTENPSQFQIAGNYNITVTGIQYDEFQRIVPFQGTASLTLITTERIFHGTILNGDSTFIFKKIPSQHFILRGEKEGFYPYEDTYYNSTAQFYPLLPRDLKVDSIQTSPGEKNSYYNDVNIRLTATKIVPNDGVLLAAIFLGLKPDVSPTPGTYFYSNANYINMPNGATYQFNKNGYPLPAGTKVYITGRLLTGASRNFYDSSAKITVFTNLEENSKIITSFTY
jgi:hypothetical protein